MTPALAPLRPWLERLWRTDAPLTATGLGMAAVLVLTMVGLWLDPRTIGGAPAWLKPAKFAASLALYSLTFAWIFSWLPEWKRTRRLAGRVTAAIFVVEMVIIAFQAARGTTSHFNVSTPLDGFLFGVMGTGIFLQTLASLAVAVALWRQTFVDRTMGWALRLGMLITVVAAASGGLMTQPTDAQLAEARSTGRRVVSGAHTVGAPDGGPGLPGTGWSTTGGDLRVAHFAGLHAMQVLPLLALAIARVRRTRQAAAKTMVVAAASYAALFAGLLWQALRGQSLIAPDAATLLVAAGWLSATALALWWVGRSDVAVVAVGTMLVHHDS